MRSQRLLFSLLGIFALALVLPLHAQRDAMTPEIQAIVKQKWPEAKRTVTGLRYVMVKEGTGDPAVPGDMLTVLYKGMLLDGTVFNECLDPASPFHLRLGRGEVIEGWDQGLKLLREGGKMILIVPYELGYGTRGNPPAVPRQATLVFEVEVLKIDRSPSYAPPAPPAPAGKKAKRN